MNDYIIPWQPLSNEIDARDWQLSQVKFAFNTRLGKMLQNELSSDMDEEVPYLKAIHVQWDSVTLEDLPTMWASTHDILELRVNQGDLLVCEGGEAGRAAIVSEQPPQNCIIQNALHLVRPRKGNDLRFFRYLLIQASAYGWLDILCNKATIAHFTVEKFREMFIWLPPAHKQLAIADYLDEQISKIDDLIAKKQRLLELLAEKQQALITHAVTKGLNPDAPMKDSGIEWLGEIPAHWETQQLRHLAQIRTSGVDKKMEEGEKKVKLCNYTDVYYNAIITEDIDFMQATASDEEINKFQLTTGDILITKDSESWNDIAVPAYVPYELSNVLCGYHLALIRSFKRSSSKFLFWAFCSSVVAYQFNIGANGITRFGLSQQVIRDSVFPVPPVDEQLAIINYLDVTSHKTKLLMSRIQEAIHLLQERRISLITAAVTGKIKVPD